MTTIKAHFDGKVLVPHEPVNVPINQEILLQLDGSTEPQVVRTKQELLALFAEMDGDVVNPNHTVDYSRDSIYGGTLDDPR
ncbi:MAG TPA: hypothetical protein VM008_14970 [Phycisphaerae bacterium]|nr:hypothetical protein [Phycisphaerae bacterium]